MAGTGDPVALCQVMVAIPSVNPELEAGGAGEEALARQCGQWLESWGYSVRLSEPSPGPMERSGSTRARAGGKATHSERTPGYGGRGRDVGRSLWG